jgi:transcriptional regulator PpsR
VFVKAFRAPQASLGTLDAQTAATLIAAVADVALIIDQDGVIIDRSFGNEELANELEGGKNWIGQPWIDTVTVESQTKVRNLLKDAGAGTEGRTRHVNHPSESSEDVPILYSTLRIGKSKHILASGRDLRTISTLQRRLLDAQASMERDYGKLRQVETRYRMLFQMSPEAVLIVDALTQRIVEANPAACALMDEDPAALVGRGFTELFNAEGQLAMQALLAGRRTGSKPEEGRVRLSGSRREITVSASMFRQEGASFYLVRLASSIAVQAADMPPREGFTGLADAAPDGVVVIAADNRIVSANQSFLEMVELTSEDQARGQSLDRWIGRLGVDMDVLMANLRQRGAVRLFSTILRGEFGASADVELSASAIGAAADEKSRSYGFVIRDIGRRAVGHATAGFGLPRSVEQLTELIGRVSLKELVRDSTDMIERLCIEAALKVTNDNRASAAEMLGLSRQSLYVKLRRYGLGDLDDEGSP